MFDYEIIFLTFNLTSMKARTSFYVILLLALLPVLAFAQKDSTDTTTKPEKPKSPLSERIFIGGNAALSFGTVTYVGLAPIIGYKITDRWSVGVGASYFYYRDNYWNYSNSIYGGLLMSRYLVFKGVFVEGNFEENNQVIYALKPNGDLTTQRDWIPSLLLGGGYSQEIGGHSALFISILYDVIQNPNSQYYRIPVIRAGIGIGL